MRAVYSTLFGAWQGLEGTEEVAPDFINLRVLRCFDVYWGGGLSGSPSVHLLGHTGQTIVEFHVPTADIGGTFDSHSWQWEGRQVIPVGGAIAVYGTAGIPVDATLSGYTLAP